jgi:hypothetical protein
MACFGSAPEAVQVRPISRVPRAVPHRAAHSRCGYGEPHRSKYLEPQHRLSVTNPKSPCLSVRGCGAICHAVRQLARFYAALRNVIKDAARRLD